MEGLLLCSSLFILFVPGLFFNCKNLVSYLTKILHETNVVAARNVSTWQGTSFLAPLVGALLADSYVGKYWTVMISLTILTTGMMILVLSAALPLIMTAPIVLPAWTETGLFQHIIFFVGLYMVAIRFGMQTACITSFGADQFDDTDEDEKTKKSSFFNWNHFTLSAGSLVSGTVLVWIQDNKGWFWGFSISTLFVDLGVGSFLLGSTVYRFQKPGGSPITRVCQVIVAATHFNTDLPCDSSLLYEIPGQVSAIEGSRKLDHTAGLEYYS